MAKDFRSKQIRTSKLIGSGGIAEGKAYLGLAIYDHRHAVNGAGTQKYDGTMQPSMLSNVGSDVWLFISGSKSSPEVTWPGGNAGQDWHGRNLVGTAVSESGYEGGKAVLFGGDVIVSGTLFAERSVVEVDEAVRGDLLVPNSAHVSGAFTSNQGAVFNLSSGSTHYTTVAGVGVPGNDFVVHGSSVSSILHIDASANRVGFGQTSPSAFIDIKSTAVNALTDVGAPANYHLRIDGSPTIGEGTGIALGSDDNVGAALVFKDTGGAAQGELQIYTKDSTVDEADPEQRMVITNDGKVGIGQNGESYGFDPDTLLEIYGPSTQLKLSNNADDYSTLGVGTNGDLTITTVDAAAGAADFVVVADGAVDIDANQGALSLDGSGGIRIGTETDVGIDIDSSTLDIDASGAITMDSTSTIVISGDGGATLSDDTKDMSYDGSGNLDLNAVALDIDATSAITIDSTTSVSISGDTGASIGDDTEALAYDGSGNVDFDAVSLDIDATTFDITSTTDSSVLVNGSGQDLSLSALGGGAQKMTLTSAGTGTDAIDINTTGGGIDVDAASTVNITATTNLTLQGNGQAAFGDDTEGLIYDGSGNADFDAVSLDIDASGAITIDGTSTLSIDSADDSNVTVTGSGKDLVLSVAGGGAQKLQLDSAGTGTDAIDISAAAGGVDIDATGKLALDGAGGIDIGVAADVAIDIDSSTLDIDASGAITIDGTSTISIDGGGALNIDTSSGALSVGTANSGIAVNIGHATSEVTIGDNLTVQGDLTVNGTTTTVNSTTMTVDDPILTLGGDSAPGSDDNKDRGVEFRWHNGTDPKIGFLGYDDSESVFTLIPDATNTSEVFSGSPGTLRVRQVDLYDDGAESIRSDGTDIHIAVGANGDVNLPANIGLTFGDDGEIIEGDGSGLTIKGGDITLDSEGDINLDAAGSDVYLKANGSNMVRVNMNSTTVQFSPMSSGQDLQFNYNNSGIYAIGTFDSGEKSFRMSNDRKIQFGDTAEFIVGDGTDLSISSSGKLLLTASSDIVIPVNVGLVLDGAGSEKIESDGTDINFSVGTGGDVNFPANIGLTFGNDGEKIEGDGTDLTIQGGDINLTAEVDVNIPANVGLTFGDDGEKIEGDGTDLTLSSGNDIKLDAVNDIILDSRAREWLFTDGANNTLKIESTGTSALENGPIYKAMTTDMGHDFQNSSGQTIAFLGSDRKLYLYDEGGEHISSDGNNLTAAAGTDISLDAGGDIILDAAGGDVDFLRDGVRNLRINLYKTSDGAKSGVDILSKGFMVLRPESGEVTLMSGSNPNSAYGTLQGFNGDMYLSSSQSDKDMIFMVNDGGTMTEVMRLDGDVSSLKIASGKKVLFGGTNVSLANSGNELVASASLVGIDAEETYYSGDVFISGTLSPSALSLSNIDLASDGYVRFGDSNNFIQRSGNDLQFRDSNTGATKTLTELMTVSGIGPFEVLSNDGVTPATLKMRSTGSFSLGANNQYADAVGNDLFFFISGSVHRGSSDDMKAAAFGGDVVITGSLKAGAILDTWTYDGTNHLYALSASMEEVGYAAPLVGKSMSGNNMFSILPGFDISKSANGSLTTILGEVSDGNIIFGVNDGGTPTEVFRLQGMNSSMRIAANKNLEFGGSSRYISSPNTTTINYVNGNTGGAHTFTGHILPSSDSTYDLGSDTLRFANIYTGDLNLKNDRGDWTILEEEDFLCVINNKTGKKFKMMLEPLEENE